VKLAERAARKLAEKGAQKIGQEVVKKGTWESIKQLTIKTIQYGKEITKVGAQATAVIEAIGIVGTGAAVAMAAYMTVDKTNEFAKSENKHLINEAESLGYEKRDLINKGFTTMKWKNQRTALFAMKKANMVIASPTANNIRDFLGYYMVLKDDDPDVANLIYSMISSSDKGDVFNEFKVRNKEGVKSKFELTNDDGSLYDAEASKPELDMDVGSIVKFDTAVRNSWKSMMDSFSFGGGDVEVDDGKSMQINPKINDGYISKAGQVTPIDEGDAIMVSKKGDNMNELVDAIKEAFKSTTDSIQGTFNPSNAKEDSLLWFEKIVEPIQKKIAENKQEKAVALNQNTIITPPSENKETIKEVIKPVEVDFVRY